jgi:hypothetical protein
MDETPSCSETSQPLQEAVDSAFSVVVGFKFTLMSVTFHRDIVSVGRMLRDALIAPATENEGVDDETVGAWYSVIKTMGPSLFLRS